MSERTLARRGAGRPSSARELAHGAIADDGLLWRRVLWVGAAALWALLVVSAVSFDSGDAPAVGVYPHNDPAHNWCGRFGAAVAFTGYQLLGLGLWVLIVLGGVHLWAAAQGRRVGHVGVRVIGAVLMAWSLAGVQALLAPDSGPVRAGAGNLLGHLAAGELRPRFNGLGTFFLLAATFMVGAVVTLDVWAVVAAIWTGRAVARAGKPVGQLALAAARTAHGRASAAVSGATPIRANDVDDDENIPGAEAGRPRTRKPRKRLRLDEQERGVELEDVEEAEPVSESARDSEPTAPETAASERSRARAGRPRASARSAEQDDDWRGTAAPSTGATAAAEGGETDGLEEGRTGAADTGEDDEAEEAPGAPQVFDPEALREKISRLPLRFAAASRRAATEDDLRDLQNVAELPGYRFPGLDLLEDPEQNYSQRLESFVREQAAALERALKEYRIDGSVVGIDSGPVITNYEVRLAPGTKVAALSAVASDLARAVKAVNIRIVPNTAGRDTVGIEVPNAIKEKVRLKELMTNTEASAKMALPMFLGKDASGEPLIADLAQMPHLLIAGTTGSGKSVCMNTVIMSFLYTKKPSELKLVLVDPKMVEMSQFKDIPHLMCPVVTEMAKAAAILEWAVGKMEERYELLAEAGCRDIAGYNQLSFDELKEAFRPSSPEEEARIPRRLPYMVFVIDELADLMMTNKEVEHSIVRIAQKARAVGIHLIIATQRPQANVVTGLIKSNMPARIAFKVASGMDSRIVLDQKGGELLLGMGDMLYLSPRSHKLMRAQGTLVDDKEIRRVVRFMREVAEPSFERQLVQIRPGAPSQEQVRDGLATAQEDPLFDQAVEIVLETKLGSVSMLQRRLAIGYTRAARLIEMMGEAGILGQHKGTVARDVLMSPEEWTALKAQAQEDAERAASRPPAPAALAEPKAAPTAAGGLFASAEGEAGQDSSGSAQSEDDEADDDLGAPGLEDDEADPRDDASEEEEDEEGEPVTDLDDAPPFDADAPPEDEDEFPDAFAEEEPAPPSPRRRARR
ncbi:MAG TPA: DNA translocase FtsK [Phycisphaerales bacterium]|nr:DNA translocase FtsK [Phycisphaerales bacterium]